MADTTYTTDNRVDGNGQPYQVQIPTPTVLPTTDASTIGTQPLNIPKEDTSALSSADTTIKGLATVKQNEVANLDTQDTNAQSDVTNLSNQLAGETGDQQTLEANAGIPQMQKDLSDLNALSSSQLAGYLGKYNALEGGGTGTVGGVSAAETALQRSHAIDALMTNSLIQAKQGNIQAATDSVTKAIAAKYEPIKQKYTNAINILNQVGTKEATAKAALLQIKLKQADDAQQNEKDVQSVVQEAAKNGAPNSVLALMSKATSPNEAVQNAGGYIQDKLAQQIQQAQLTKLNQEISQGALTDKVYIPGSNPQVDALIASINSGKSKLSDIPASQAALKNLVQQGLALSSGSTSDILSTTQASLKELNDMVTNDQGFSSAVGQKGFLSGGLFGLFGGKEDPHLGGAGAGTARANFDAKLAQVKNDIILPNLTLLHGLGRVTDREFQALTSAVTSLSSSTSESQFKSELKDITDRINTKIDTGSTQNTQSIPKGQTQLINGHTYVSDGTQWVLQE